VDAKSPLAGGILRATQQPIKEEKEMENYKNETIYLGESDAAFLTVVGITTDGVKAEILNMGGDGTYSAYIVRNWQGLLPEHYRRVMSFVCYTQFGSGEIVNLGTWVKFYDDHGHVTELRGKRISIYRAGDYGILIHIEE
jgi:hypothetical protein